MKLAKSMLMAWLMVSAMVGLLVLAATGCNKVAGPGSNHPTLSPEQAKEQRLEWNLKTLVEPYEKAGHTNPKWDGLAKAALTEFARVRALCVGSNEAWGVIIVTNCSQALGAGCDDPMVRYLYVRFGMSQTNSAQAFADALCKVAVDMDNSLYPPIRKFYAAQRAVDQLFFTYGYNTNNLVLHPVFGQIEPLVGKSLMPALDDRTMPAEEAFEACDTALNSVSGDSNAYSQAYECIEKPLFENWRNVSTSWLLKGNAYLEMAWLARGGGYANNVKQERWKLFFERLKVAENALTNAWRLDPTDARIPTTMIRVDEGLQKDRKDMELWFSRAMKIDPDNYQACEYKLHYLYPQWYGSRDDMIAFGEECVASKTWGGKVPLILSDAHREYWLYLNDPEVRSNYWKRPDVWPDIKASFDRFFELNPNAVAWRHNYAWYAYQCGRWDEFNHQLSLFSSGTNYDYFGGKTEFDEMVQQAEEHAGGGSVGPNK